MDKQAVSKFIRKRRKLLKMTIEELSAATNISIENIKQYENGDFEPKAKEIHALAITLKVPPLVLLHGGGKYQYLKIDESGHKVSEWKEY